jgi:hypothetical protein
MNNGIILNLFLEPCAYSRIIRAGTEERAEKTADMVTPRWEKTVVASDTQVSMKKVRTEMRQVERSGK